MNKINIDRETVQAAIAALQWFASDIPTPKTLADQKRAEDLGSLLEALHAAPQSPVEPTETLSDERIEELSMPYIERSAFNRRQPWQFKDLAALRNFARAILASRQAEPACPGCGASVLYECVHCGSGNYPPEAKVEPRPVTALEDSVLRKAARRSATIIYPAPAEPPEAKPAEWLPIETVANNGTHVLCISRSNRISIEAGRHMHDMMAAAKEDGEECFYTHWMPLPVAQPSNTQEPSNG